MSSTAIDALKEILTEAQNDYATVAADNKPAIDEGRRAQVTVDVASRRVEELRRAVNTLEQIERENQVEVDAPMATGRFPFPRD